VHGIDRYVPVMYDAPGAPGYERVYRLTAEGALAARAALARAHRPALARLRPQLGET